MKVMEENLRLLFLATITESIYNYVNREDVHNLTQVGQ